MKSKTKHLLSFASLLIFAVLAISSSEGTTVSETETPSQNVVAKQIFEDFSQNEVAAKAKYGDKVIAVRGIVATIETYGDGSVVLLNDGNSSNVGVKCYFNEDQAANTSSLVKGQAVKIIGIGEGSLVVDYQVRNCRMGVLGQD